MSNGSACAPGVSDVRVPWYSQLNPKFDPPATPPRAGKGVVPGLINVNPWSWPSGCTLPITLCWWGGRFSNFRVCCSDPGV
jgi:hypothetical protein